jgi:hypothetical protein
MKLKIGVYLTSDVAKLLWLAVKRSGATMSDIVNEALLGISVLRTRGIPSELCSSAWMAWRKRFDASIGI